jgi:hypothetical protein
MTNPAVARNCADRPSPMDRISANTQIDGDANGIFRPAKSQTTGQPKFRERI